MRGASHQPAYMGSCLIISHTCLLCLPSGKTLFQSDLLVAGKLLSCERWESSKQGRGKRVESNVLGRWEKWKGSEMGKWQKWDGSKLGR